MLVRGIRLDVVRNTVVEELLGDVEVLDVVVVEGFIWVVDVLTVACEVLALVVVGLVVVDKGFVVSSHSFRPSSSRLSHRKGRDQQSSCGRVWTKKDGRSVRRQCARAKTGWCGVGRDQQKAIASSGDSNRRGKLSFKGS